MTRRIRELGERVEDLEGDDPEPEYTEEDLELTAEDKQILEETFSVDEDELP